MVDWLIDLFIYCSILDLLVDWVSFFIDSLRFVMKQEENFTKRGNIFCFSTFSSARKTIMTLPDVIKSLHSSMTHPKLGAGMISSFFHCHFRLFFHNFKFRFSALVRGWCWTQPFPCAFFQTNFNSTWTCCWNSSANSGSCRCRSSRSFTCKSRTARWDCARLRPRCRRKRIAWRNYNPHTTQRHFSSHFFSHFSFWIQKIIKTHPWCDFCFVENILEKMPFVGLLAPVLSGAMDAVQVIGWCYSVESCFLPSSFFRPNFLSILFLPC